MILYHTKLQNAHIFFTYYNFFLIFYLIYKYTSYFYRFILFGKNKIEFITYYVIKYLGVYMSCYNSNRLNSYDNNLLF